MELQRFFWLVLIAAAASLVQSSTGFGFSILAMSLWPLVMPYKTAASVTAFSSVTMILFITWKLRRHINFKGMLYPLISSTVTSLIGVYVMVRASDAVMLRALGLLLVLLSVYFIFYGSRISIAQTPRNGLIAGAVSGLCSGLFNLGGPPMVIYCLSSAADKNEYSATLQFYFAINGSIVILLHLLAGNIDLQIMQFSAMSLVGVAAGTLGGYALFQKISLLWIRRLVYGFMLLFGLYLLIWG